MGLGEADFILTTRQTAYCPDAVTAGYDHDAAEDAGFRVTCEVSFEEAAQDPGIPAAPLEVLKPGRAISSSARDTLRSSACFRSVVCFRLSWTEFMRLFWKVRGTPSAVPPP